MDIIAEINNCENMSDIKEVTPIVRQFVQDKDFDTKHQILNILSDKTFEVHLNEYPVIKPKKVVKKPTKKVAKKPTKKVGYGKKVTVNKKLTTKKSTKK